MPIISAVGLFWYDKFEETPNEKVVNMSKLNKPYFKSSRERILRTRSRISQLLLLYNNVITLDLCNEKDKMGPGSFYEKKLFGFVCIILLVKNGAALRGSSFIFVKYY